ncbi:MAG: ATP phosphoribosyltransferase regulatory subunit [Clostridia bacterium]|nr:ATP phosphoribosyltransferase regulatory subunit [Clostridia bacterium]
MNVSANVLKNDERAIYQLRALYKKYGYSHYKVSKFEEYDLYSRHKNFLVSQNVLTFTDTNGKLLALKPDVTLSIIKHIPQNDGGTHKLCYNENVYRTSADSDGFREIMQTGLECIGEIDLYAECEVLMLAMRSLETISADYILDLSHMGMVEGLLEEAMVDEETRAEMISLIESKNVNALVSVCKQRGVSLEMQLKLSQLTEMYLPIERALPLLSTLIVGEKMQVAYEKLSKIHAVMREYGLSDRLYLDFSIVNDATYYDSLSFQGFINGISESVLSGGRYDRLMKQLSKNMGAIGFAVYLDRLERFEWVEKQYDTDVVLLYDDDVTLEMILKTQNELITNGFSVLTTKSPDQSLRFRKLLKLTEGGLQTLETND